MIGWWLNRRRRKKLEGQLEGAKAALADHHQLVYNESSTSTVCTCDADCKTCDSLESEIARLEIELRYE